jgi:cellulose synthase/poly-beta-1,6-N-acetylglucosamine synthase-like glycosyltransferase
MLIAAELALILMWFRIAAFCVLGISAGRRHPTPDELIETPLQISVVVPALDEEKTIEATLFSLLRHDPVPWEIIFVDDGSTDKTAELARHCLAKFERARIIELPTNLGKAEALNIGIRAASCDLVVTIDADTRLEKGALKAAIAKLSEYDAGAVAFYLEVENQFSMLGRLQQQEYVAALNFERAGQDVIGAICILPGAATLCRRELLLAHPFSSRTRTEDADLTLHLSRRGVRIVLATDAVASTVVPSTLAGLLAQRVRWTVGHLQCCVVHAFERCTTRLFFNTVVFPNFLLSTFVAAVGCISLVTILIAGSTSLLGLDWFHASTISLLLVYLQRGSVFILEYERHPRLKYFILEPFFTNLVSIVCFIGAVCALLYASVYLGRKAVLRTTHSKALSTDRGAELQHPTPHRFHRRDRDHVR